MNKDGMYYKVVQEYLRLNTEKRELMRERDAISAKLGTIDGILIDLNDILCIFVLATRSVLRRR